MNDAILTGNLNAAKRIIENREWDYSLPFISSVSDAQLNVLVWLQENQNDVNVLDLLLVLDQTDLFLTLLPLCKKLFTWEAYFTCYENTLKGTISDFERQQTLIKIMRKYHSDSYNIVINYAKMHNNLGLFLFLK